MTRSTADIVTLDALGPAGAYASRSHQEIKDVAGNPVARLGLVPTLFVSRAMTALRRSARLPVDDRIAAIARAGELFATATLGGLSVSEYEYRVSRVSGLPLSVVRAATRTAAHRAAHVHESVQYARPAGSVGDWRDPLTRSGRAVWSRRGDVLAVHVSGVHPGAHSLWLEALALGFKVAVRPTRREPFTAHRLVTALWEAGFGTDHVILLPTEQEAGEAVLRGADLAYGGDDVIRRFAGESTVLPQEPGRSKVLLTAGTDWRAHLDMIVDSVAHHGGTGCVNATAVLVEGDPAPVAEAIAARFTALPSLPPEDEKAVLPVQARMPAKALERYVLNNAVGTRAWLGGDGFIDELEDGSAVLRPTVHQLDSPTAPQSDLELPFPCVWVAPWTPEAGLEPLRDTLVLTAVTDDARLIDDLVNEPTIGNLYIGGHPTHWTDIGMPHDGYLSDFLMRTKTVIRG
ncbi:aldehyde dehydrogenase family protein [Streptomyces sp. BH-SS-21]|uniref:Aldehyde dehydrogenase family protein n=1 Tax=Streptomyces liliiviolaceus TaxID=2823109 RepID=A0A941B9W6_9ACTN|nr:aldehyde dehydrogenase family protein [Streptomyces liliiviolaceus]MBQ0850498.1 aldehyde dehydrogenase family protein [Streptomyces liliiviolaceus]